MRTGISSVLTTAHSPLPDSGRPTTPEADRLSRPVALSRSVAYSTARARRDPDRHAGLRPAASPLPGNPPPDRRPHKHSHRPELLMALFPQFLNGTCLRRVCGRSWSQLKSWMRRGVCWEPSGVPFAVRNQCQVSRDSQAPPWQAIRAGVSLSPAGSALLITGGWPTAGDSRVWQ